MKTLLLLCLLPLLTISAPREGRQFGWLRDLFGGGSSENSPVISNRRIQIDDGQSGRRFGPVKPLPRQSNRRLSGPTNYQPPGQEVYKGKIQIFQ